MTTDDYPDFTQVWECEAPPEGTRFKVLEDEWDHSGEKPTRIIRRVEVERVSVDGVG